METKFSSVISNGVTVRFPSKPPDRILAMMKANGFRYRHGLWYRQRVAGSADFLLALECACNPGKPDGACWTCGKPGRFRHEGAATPVRCDECQAVAVYWEALPRADRERYRNLSPTSELSAAQLAYSYRADSTDLAYEVDCARACGI